MTTSTLITDYMGSGTHASRPAAPNVPTGGTAVYYETDTGNSFAWDSTAPAWIQLNSGGGGGAPVIVQSAVIVRSSVTAIVMGSAPIAGNTLIAVCAANGISSPATGWTAVYSSGNFGIFIKTAGASEPTTQTVFSSGIAGCIGVYEFTGTAIVGNLFTYPGASSPTVATPLWSGATTDMIIGTGLNVSNTSLCSSITGGTLDATDSDVSAARSAVIYHKAPTSIGNNSLTSNWSSGLAIYSVVCTVHTG